MASIRLFLPVDLAALAAGDQPALIAALANLASGWMLAGGSSLQARPHLSVVDAAIVGEPAHRALRAAACDLVDLIGKTPHGRKALGDLGLEPVLQKVERE